MVAPVIRATSVAAVANVPNVQTAINDSTNLATIRICAGTYTGSINLGKSLTLIGQESIWDVLNGTVLHVALGSNSSVEFLEGIDQAVTLLTLTMSGGNSVSSGGIALDGTPALTMTNCLVVRNRATNQGAGLFNEAGTVTLNNCQIVQNITEFGQGGGIYDEQGSITLNDCTVTDNSAAGAGAGGLTGAGCGSWRLPETTVHAVIALLAGWPETCAPRAHWHLLRFAARSFQTIEHAARRVKKVRSPPSARHMARRRF